MAKPKLIEDIENLQTLTEGHTSQLADKATKVELQSVASGSPKGVYATASALTTAYPSGNTNIYVVTADGNWYYWNGSAWIAGGVYQASFSITQTTGSSDVQIMSQKATTNELFKTRINLKELKRSGNNLVDYNAITASSYIGTDGSINSLAGYYISDYIKLNGNNISGNWLASGSTVHLAVYNSNFALLRTVVPSSQTYTYQSGDYYVRAVFRDTTTQPIVNYGNSVLAFEVYAETNKTIATNSSDISTVQSGLNSANINIEKNRIAIKETCRTSTNLLDSSVITSSKAINTDGTLFTVSGYYVTDYIKVNGKNISGNWLSSTSTVHIAVYDSNFTLLRTDNTNTRLYQYQSGDYYVRAVFRTTETSPMINYGNTLLTYSAYSEKTDNTSNSSIPNIVYVGTQNGCDYSTIQAALNSITDDSENNHYIIYIMPGTYEKFSMIDNDNRLHYISLIGFDRTTTIIKSDTGTYETPPAEIWTNGTIENLTFIMQTSAGTYTGQGAQLQAYAVHQDFGTCETLYKNCVFQSNSGPAGGFGMFQDGKMRFHECDFICDCDNTYGTNTLGAMFIHCNSETAATNQYAEFRNCNAINKYGTDGFRLRIPTGATGSYSILVQNCLSWGVSGASAFVNTAILDTKSFGNNVASLNA